VNATSPSPAPCTVTDADPVPAEFDRRNTLTLPESKEIATDVLPPRSPAVIIIRRVHRTPWPTRHLIDVSDSHSVPSHPVCPIRPSAVNATSPKPDPCTVTKTDPVPTPLARTWLDSVLTSYDTCCDITLRLAPIVIEAGSVLPMMTRVSLHAIDVYDVHSLASQAVNPNPDLCVK
jgi:hypothetical protein